MLWHRRQEVKPRLILSSVIIHHGMYQRVENWWSGLMATTELETLGLLLPTLTTSIPSKSMNAMHSTCAFMDS